MINWYSNEWTETHDSPNANVYSMEPATFIVLINECAMDLLGYEYHFQMQPLL